MEYCKSVPGIVEEVENSGDDCIIVWKGAEASIIAILDPGSNNDEASCQLRRLGARGGAGKPTLLSLKN
jgi:hypothetical protein